MILNFTVWGQARPKGSHDPFVHPSTGQVLVRHTSKGLRVWEAAVREEAQKFAAQRVFFLGPVRVEINFVFARPKSVSVKKRPHMTTAPDLDKISRSCLDPLSGVIYRDDAQVTELTVTKRYGASDEPSFAVLTITELDGVFGARMELLARQEDSHAIA